MSKQTVNNLFTRTSCCFTRNVRLSQDVNAANLLCWNLEQ